MRSSFLLAIAVALALLAGCASPESRKMEATPYAEEPGPEVKPWADFIDAEDSPAPTWRAPDSEPAFALVRVESGRVVDPTPADLQALDIAAGDGAAALGTVRVVVRATTRDAWKVIRSVYPPWSAYNVSDLRRLAAGLGARLLLVVRFEALGRERRLTATLHETATGREISRYGPGEPSLTLAAHHLAKALH